MSYSNSFNSDSDPEGNARTAPPISRRASAHRGPVVIYVNFAMPVGYRSPVKGLVRWIRENPPTSRATSRTKPGSSSSNR